MWWSISRWIGTCVPFVDHVDVHGGDVSGAGRARDPVDGDLADLVAVDLDGAVAAGVRRARAFGARDLAGAVTGPGVGELGTADVRGRRPGREKQHGEDRRHEGVPHHLWNVPELAPGLQEFGA
jgi:hypothetical protein